MAEQVNRYITKLMEVQNDRFSLIDILNENHDENKVAFYYENSRGDKAVYTYGKLNQLSKKFARVLKNAGVGKGTKVAVLLPKGVETFVSALAIWRLGAVYLPLFTAFEHQAIQFRIQHSKASVIITDRSNRSKISDALANLDRPLKLQVITVDCRENIDIDLDFWKSLKEAEAYEEKALVKKEDPFILIYTSGTTGDPKGVPVPVYALNAFEIYMRFGLDVKENDIFWNVADPGWAYGLYYGVVGPFILGQSFIVYEGRFSISTIYRILRDYGVTNFTGAPTVYRTMRVYGAPSFIDELKLKRLSSAGEPLNPDVNKWSQAVFGRPIYDHYGQTELGMAIVNHHHENFKHDLKIGSMGKALPGYRAVVLDKQSQEVAPGIEGELAFDLENSPILWFQGYLKDEKRTNEQYSPCGRYYLTGDTASYDEEEMFFFSGRDDDIIISSGYKIGPFDVESSLMKHESVAESAVIGIPDENRGEIVKAFVVLRPGYEASDDLAKELRNFVKKNLSGHEYPRVIEFLEQLPKTPSGKVQRYLLKSN